MTHIRRAKSASRRTKDVDIGHGRLIRVTILGEQRVECDVEVDLALIERRPWCTWMRGNALRARVESRGE